MTKQWPTLEKAAHQLVGNVSSLVVLQHYMERELAELLSIPSDGYGPVLMGKAEQGMSLVLASQPPGHGMPCLKTIGAICFNLYFP